MKALGRLALACATIVAALSPATVARAEPPTVVVDIKPLAGLAAAVMDGIGAPIRLIPDNASPHGHALRPSEALALARADVVLWMGPIIAPSLAGPIANLGADATVSDLSSLDGLTRLPMRAGGAWTVGDEAHDGHGHETEADPHLWLAPDNATIMAGHIATILTAADPDNGPRYAANLARLTTAIGAATDDARATVAPVRDTPFLVRHDAYRYFEHAFGLAAAGALSGSHAQAPGAARLAALRGSVSERGIVCVFVEPGRRDDRAATLVAQGGAARVAPLDPLGRDIVVDAAFYPTLIRHLAGDLAACLGARR